MNKIKKYMIFLIKKIEYLDYNYYVLNKSQISDFKYDKLTTQIEYLSKKYFKIFNSINKKNSYNMISNNFSQYAHISKMLSIKSTYDINNLIKFNNKNFKILNKNNIKYCCETKLDGIAINLIYKNGILFKILTRGNGLIGENVIKNINYINNIPIKLNFNKKKNVNLIEIKGEVCISKSNFIYINKKLENNKKFKTCRNAASGIIRNIKYIEIYNNILDFIPYNIIFNNNILNKNKYYDHFKNFNYIKSLGFNLNQNIKLFNSIYESINYYLYILKIRKKIIYDIDGIVIKVNDIKDQLILGNSNKFPNWSIAIKFLSEFKKTKLINIKYSIGRTGTIIPIGELEPIYISGILVKNVSLINFKKIKFLNLKIKSIVYIELSSGIIPKIKKVISNKNNIDINIPKKCPFCNYEIKFNLNKLKCENSFFCKNQIKYKIIHFFSKKCIYINGVDKMFINKLFKKNIIFSPIDIFKLNLKIIKQNINKKYFNIELPLKYKKKVDFENFIYALGIEGIGEKTSRIISKKIKNIYYFIENNSFNLKILNDINILKIKFFMKNKNNIFFIKELINKYIEINYK